MDELSHDDLIEYALELQRQNDQKEDEIAELTQSQTGGKGKGKRGNFSSKEELEALETENEDLRTQVEACQLQISDMREQVSNTNVKLTALKNEKVESDKKIKAQAKRLEELEKEIIEVNNRGRSAELQSKEFNKQKSANVKEAQRLWEENESLKEEIKQLEGQLTGVEEEKAFMESLIAKFADEKDELAAKVDAADVEMDEMHQAHLEVEKQLEETQLRLQASNLAEGELEQRISTLEAELRAVQDKNALELKTHVSEVKGLKEQIAVLKDSTKVGEKQRALETLQAETADNTKLIDELHTSLESALQERDLLSEKLIELENGIEQRVADRIASERNKAKELALTIESLKAHHADNLEHYATLEAEKALLVREVDELTSWKAVYEAGHGLQEMARNQKKLRDDNRRLSVAVEQYNNKLSMVLDANGILTQAFEKLKKEAGKPADFFYPEFSLQTEVQSVNASLQYQLRELEEQVVGLENENTRIRSAMKNQAASIGEQGFKYAGMTPDMLLQVNDFATSLREGRVELPLNDRSQVLLKENRSLRQDIDGMKLRLERYERELGGAVYSTGPAPLATAPITTTTTSGGGLNADGSNNNTGVINPVAEDMARLASENHALHTKMNALQSDLTQLLQNTTHNSNSAKNNANDNTVNNALTTAGVAENDTNTSNGMISVAELSNILIQNNQLMMRELNSLRQSASYNNNTSVNSNQYTQYGSNPVQDTVLQHVGSGKSAPLTAAMNRAQLSYRSGLNYSVSGAPGTPGPAGSSNTVTFNVPSTSPRPSGPPNNINNDNNNNNPNNPLWTPSIARGGMPFGSGANAAAGIPFGTPYPGAAATATPAGPATPHGKSLLQNTLTQLNLPPEEWALDVRDLHTQLVECLEQLYSREQELEDTQSIVSTLETQLVGIKQQMTSLYYDYALKSEHYEKHTATLHTEAVQLNAERDDLRLKLRRMTDMAQLLQGENPTTLTSTLTDLTRKVTIYEVNEAVLSRKFIAQSEQLTQEQHTRQALETDFIEMETSLKKRILYLEQYKLAASARIAHLQGKVDSSVSSADYTALQAEIDSLREDHLNTLRREVEARMSALHTLDQARELRSARIIIAHLNADLQAASAGKTSLEAELQHQKEVTSRALQTSHSSVEVSQLVSELARFRGEASRLEVELMAANRRCELITQRVDDVTHQCEVADQRVRELETRMDELHGKETAARKAALETMLRYEGDLTRAEAEELQSLHSKTLLALDEAKREVVRHKELALIATEQAQALHAFKKNHETELSELKEYCTKLEARTDDDLLIGKLQRKLMSTTTSYRAFTRKYQQAREAMRRRELGMRVLEGRLDEQDRAVMKAQEANRLEVSALKKALLNLKNTVFESSDSAALVHKDSSSSTSNTTSNTTKEEKKKSKIRTLAKSGFATVTVGAKLIDISHKVDTLAGQATDAVQRAATAEDTVRTLQGQIEDLLCDKAILTQQTNDLVALTSNKAKQKTLAQRLITLSDEVRTNKIAFLQQRRAVQVLRQEKRHLQSIISNIEADVMELEVNKVNSETRAVLFDIHDNTDVMEGEFSEELLGLGSGEEKHDRDKRDKNGKESRKSFDGTASDFPHREPIDYNNSMKKGKKDHNEANNDTRLSLDMDLITDNEEGGQQITPEQLYKKLHNANAEHAATRRELSDFKLRTSTLQHEVSEISALLQEKEGQVAYYERVLQQEGLPALIMPHSGNSTSHHVPYHGLGNNNNRHSSGATSQSRPYRLLHEEQEQLQEAASVTIGSLRALLEEKNAIIERHRSTIERLTQAGHTAGKSRADKRADDLLDRLNHEAGEEARARRYGVALHPEVFSQGIGGATEAERTHLKQLLTQIEAADGIILEKDNTIQALEHKLLAEQNTRERAELRCGESLKEANAMKEDMLLLVQQLQDERAKIKHLSATHHTRTLLPTYPTSTVETAQVSAHNPLNNNQMANKLADAQKQLKTKEAKLKQYHSIIITLKEEFIKLERDKAEQEVLLHNKLHSTTNKSSTNTNNAANQEDIRHMQDTIMALRGKLTACDGDLKKAKNMMEVLRNDKNTFQKQAEDLEREAVEAQKKCDTAQQGYHRLRKELEDARKKEVKYRERLKDTIDSHKTNALAKDRIEALEREVDVLKAQNAALNSTHEEFSKSNKDEGGGKTEGGGHLLGTGPGGPIDEARRLQADKWAEDQKLKKRLNVLQSRLAEMQSANEDLQTQVSKGRENLQSALQAKEELSKKVQAGARAVQETKRMTLDDLTEIEQAHSKIFSLEEELVSLRRKAHVEQANEIAALSHQISSQRARILELEGEISDSEVRRKRAAANSGAGRSLREDEEAFLREERLKDDLDLSRRQKLELEAALLDRDARAIESKFDLESSELEVVRLKRRVKELEQAYKSLSTLNSNTAGGGTGGAGTKGGHTSSSTSGVSGSKKEQELEGVIEALKRVIDRLKAENDRLSGTKKGVTGATTTTATSATGDGERKYLAEKKRAEALEAENKILTDKMRGHEESSQKIVQRQQQIAQLRKQLSSKSEEIAALKEAQEGVIVERETIKRKASALQDRINELEIQLHKASSSSRAPVSTTNANNNNAAELQELKARIGTMSTENDSLKMQLHDLRKSLKNNNNTPTQTAAASAANNNNTNLNVASVQAELQRVKDENVLLRKELSAFDIDFFEEIENLKYAHAEAIRKLKMYEQSGAGGTASGGRLGGYRS